MDGLTIWNDAVKPNSSIQVARKGIPDVSQILWPPTRPTIGTDGG